MEVLFNYIDQLEFNIIHLLFFLTISRIVLELKYFKKSKLFIYKKLDSFLANISILPQDSWEEKKSNLNDVIKFCVGLTVFLGGIGIIAYWFSYDHSHLNIPRTIAWIGGFIILVCVTLLCIIAALAGSIYIIYLVFAIIGSILAFLRNIFNGSTSIAIALISVLISGVLQGVVYNKWEYLVLILLVTFSTILLFLTKKKTFLSDDDDVSEKNESHHLIRLIRYTLSSITYIAVLSITLAVNSISAYSIHNTIWHHKEKVIWHEPTSKPVLISGGFTATRWQLGQIEHNFPLYRPTVVPLNNTSFTSDTFPLMHLALEIPEAPKKQVLSIRLNVKWKDKAKDSIIHDFVEGMYMPILNGYGVLSIYPSDDKPKLELGTEYLIEISTLYNITRKEERIGVVYKTFLETSITLASEQTDEWIIKTPGLKSVNKMKWLIDNRYTDENGDVKYPKDSLRFTLYHGLH